MVIDVEIEYVKQLEGQSDLLLGSRKYTAIRASRFFIDAIIRAGKPFVVWPIGAYPPIPLVSAGNDLVRRDLAVPMGMPLHSQIRE